MTDLLDANVLIGVFRRADADSAALRAYLDERLLRGEAVTFPPLVEAAFLRIVTNRRIFSDAAAFTEAAKFLQSLQENPAYRETPWTAGTRRQWRMWCESLKLSGDDVNDAYLAAIASEHGFRLVSRDRGFARFRGIGWWNPVQHAA